MRSYVWRIQKKIDILCYECLGNFSACPLPPNKRFKGLKISDEYGRSDSDQVWRGLLHQSRSLAEARHHITLGTQLLWSLSNRCLVFRFGESKSSVKSIYVCSLKNMPKFGKTCKFSATPNIFKEKSVVFLFNKKWCPPPLIMPAYKHKLSNLGWINLIRKTWVVCVEGEVRGAGG